ncbi:MULTISPECIES: helix-turn-helix transcriptional regulator [Pedobacter]|uniref:helix-turn-helix transcriptional regulator n=1 Tax=Pedobacter TaxID=84567 RepID=UPI002109C67A|nr:MULTISPECIES: AraC family transcriptional regulator [unclassified Pedobacter]
MEKTYFDSEIQRRLDLARDFMARNYHRNIGLKDIAIASCLSVNHLLRNFKRAYHTSPYQYLRSLRLQHAKYYLKHSDYTVGQIVDVVGFECPSSFIRLFRSSFNITPGQYRAN